MSTAPQASTEVLPDAPIVCTIRPGDDEDQRMELYRTVFTDPYLSGQRTTYGIRWSFRAEEGIESSVRTLAALEQRCCPFLRMTVSVADGQVHWQTDGPANAQPFLDEYLKLPETISGSGSFQELVDRTVRAGLTVNDQRHQATQRPEEH